MALVVAAALHEASVSGLLLGANALVFLGVAIALAAALPDYESVRERMTSVGLGVGYVGGAGVLVGTATEHAGWWAWATVAFVLVVVLVVVFFKGWVRGILS